MNAEASLFVRQQASENTRRAYEIDLRYWFKWLGSRKPSEKLAMAYREHLSRTLAPNSAMRRFNTVKSFYKWVGDDNFGRIKGLRRVKDAVPKVPADDEVDRFVTHISSARDRAVVLLLLNGLRASEVAGLRYSDLSFVGRYNRWVVNVIGKGNKQRTVPLSREAASAVLNYLGEANQHKASDPLIWPNKGRSLTLRQVEYIVDKWSKVSGVDLHPHALRHHFATRLARANVNQNALQRLLGHESAETTAQYVSLNLSDLVDAMNNDPRSVEGERQLRLVS